MLARALDSGCFYRQKQRPVLAELVLDGKVEAIGELYRGKRLGSSPVISSAFEATDEFFLNGRYRTVYFTAAVVRDAAGEVLGAIETLQGRHGQGAGGEEGSAARAAASRAGRAALGGRAARAPPDRHGPARRGGPEPGGDQDEASTPAGPSARGGGGRRAGAGAGAVLEDVFRLINEASRSTRTLTFGLCPPALYDLGLPAAMEGLAERITREHGIDCRVESGGAWVHLDDDLCGLLFRSARELVLNAVKHAHCRSIVVSVARVRRRVRITVADDGIGFDPSRVDRYSEKGGGFGLFSVRERLACLGGRLMIDSQPRGATCPPAGRASPAKRDGGTRVTIEAPATQRTPPPPRKKAERKRRSS